MTAKRHAITASENNEAAAESTPVESPQITAARCSNCALNVKAPAWQRRSKKFGKNTVMAGDEIDRAFATLIQGQTGPLIIGGDPFSYRRQEPLVGLVTRWGVPAIYNRPEYISAGGLISYGSSFTAAFHQLGAYASKLLHGADLAELPVQLPTKFELVIDLNTAGDLGLTIPPALLARADELIE